MRIGIDVISPGGAVFATRGGVKTHLANLVAALTSVAPENEYVLFSSRHATLPNGHSSCRALTCKLVPKARMGRVVYEQVALPGLVARERIDVFLGTSNTLPLLLRCPSVVILQTLQYFYFPESFRPLRRYYLKQMVPLSLRKASRIIAVSDYERRDAIGLMNLPEDKFRVVHHGVATFWFEEPGEEEQRLRRDWLQKLTRGRPIVLSVSTLYHFKNYRRLVEAFALLKKQQRIPHVLVIAGSDADYAAQELLRDAEAHGIAEDVVCAGRLDEDAVRFLYRAAEVMVYPSLYETFGLPLLEAMASQCPVVAAQVTSLPEVGGASVVFVDPYDAGDIAAGIHRVISSSEVRKDLIRRGLVRASQFTWDRTARLTLQTIADAVESRGTRSR